MKKWLRSLIIVSLLAAVLSVSTAAANGPVYVYPFGGSYTATTSDTVVIQWAWIATAPGLARTYRHSVYSDYTLSGPGGYEWTLSDAQADAYWSGLLSAPDDAFAYECPSGMLYGFLWTAEVGTLDEGTYTLTSHIGNTKIVNDGFHLCTDAVTGEPLADAPSLFPAGVHTNTVTITITPP